MDPSRVESEEEGVDGHGTEFDPRASSVRLLEEALSAVHGLRRERSAGRAVAQWRAEIRGRRERGEKIAMARGLARWNVLQSHFLGLLVGTTECLRARERGADQFRTQALLQNTVYEWGPGRKLRAAELLGQADRALRKIVSAWRNRVAWASWRVFMSLCQEKSVLDTRMRVVLASVNRSSSKEALHHWCECSRGRESLRPALAKLSSIARLARLTTGYDMLCITARGGHAAVQLCARVLTAGPFDAIAQHAADGGAAEGRAIARRAARAWRARTAHWRQVCEIPST